MGAVFAPTRCSLVRISSRDLVADGKYLVRNSGVGGGGENLILKKHQGDLVLVHDFLSLQLSAPRSQRYGCECECEF